MTCVESQTSSQGDSKHRIESAKNGCNKALGNLLDEAREYLHGIAVAAIDSDIQAKLSASDLVQETLVDAHRSFQTFQGDNTRQLVAWLRRILINNLLNHYRNLRDTKKRDVSRENLDVQIDHVEAFDGDTPSNAAMLREEGVVLEEELAQLPQHYRELIELRHRDELSFVEIAERLGKSPDSVRMTWYRAFDRLSKAIEKRLQ